MNIKKIFLILLLLTISKSGFADCCKNKKEDGSPDACTNRVVMVIVPKADGTCMAYGDFYAGDLKTRMPISPTQICPSCGHYIFDHNCNPKQKDNGGGGLPTKQAKVMPLGACK